MPYVIDADVLMQAKNAHYAFDICPGFWTWLELKHIEGVVSSVAKIKDEVLAGQDELADWAVLHPEFFVAPDAATLASLQVLSNWATTNGYTNAAISEFLASGEYYLIAHAHAHGETVVTGEVAANTPNKVKVPNACAGVGVPCINCVAMLRAENASFVLVAGAPEVHLDPVVALAPAVGAIALVGGAAAPATQAED